MIQAYQGRERKVNPKTQRTPRKSFRQTGRTRCFESQKSHLGQRKGGSGKRQTRSWSQSQKGSVTPGSQNRTATVKRTKALRTGKGWKSWVRISSQETEVTQISRRKTRKGKEVTPEKARQRTEKANSYPRRRQRTIQETEGNQQQKVRRRLGRPKSFGRKNQRRKDSRTQESQHPRKVHRITQKQVHQMIMFY